MTFARKRIAQSLCAAYSHVSGIAFVIGIVTGDILPFFFDSIGLVLIDANLGDSWHDFLKSGNQ